MKNVKQGSVVVYAKRITFIILKIRKKDDYSLEAKVLYFIKNNEIGINENTLFTKDPRLLFGNKRIGNERG